MPDLDKSSRNQLGKQVFAPTTERTLLNAGYVFAAIVPSALHETVILRCRRPIAEAVTDSEIAARRALATHQPVAVPA